MVVVGVLLFLILLALVFGGTAVLWLVGVVAALVAVGFFFVWVVRACDRALSDPRYPPIRGGRDDRR